MMQNGLKQEFHTERLEITLFSSSFITFFPIFQMQGVLNLFSSCINIHHLKPGERKSRKWVCHFYPAYSDFVTTKIK